MIRWFRSFAATSPADGPTGSGRGFRLGGLLPVLGMAVIAAFIPNYWLPIRGEIASAKPRRDSRGQA